MNGLLTLILLEVIKNDSNEEVTWLGFVQNHYFSLCLKLVIAVKSMTCIPRKMYPPTIYNFLPSYFKFQNKYKKQEVFERCACVRAYACVCVRMRACVYTRMRPSVGVGDD